MSEREVMDILKKNKDAVLSAKEICDFLENPPTISNIQRAIKQLLKSHEIKEVNLDVRIARKIYGKSLKRGIRVFYIDI